jgi:hypothetical protein
VALGLQDEVLVVDMAVTALVALNDQPPVSGEDIGDEVLRRGQALLCTRCGRAAVGSRLRPVGSGTEDGHGRRFAG